jgi:hypothetical protein
MGLSSPQWVLTVDLEEGASQYLEAGEGSTRLAATTRRRPWWGKDVTIFDGVVPHPRIGTRRSVVHACRSGIHAHGSGEAHAHAHTGEAADWLGGGDCADAEDGPRSGREAG